MIDLQAELLAAAELTHRRALGVWEDATRAEYAMVHAAAGEGASAPHGYWQAKHRAGLVLEASVAVLAAIRDN